MMRKLRPLKTQKRKLQPRKAQRQRLGVQRIIRNQWNQKLQRRKKMPKTREKDKKAPKKAQSVKKSQRSTTHAVTAQVTKTKEVAFKKTTKKAQVQGESSRLSAPVFDISGRRLGQVALPKETFGGKINEELMAQAIRVYFANRHPKTASAKTRSEVKGGGRKPWRQKGTGRARAGSTRSPLWVGGGVTFGPKPEKTELTLPKKMRQKALISALSLAKKEGSINVLSNIEKIEPKTKAAAILFKKLSISGRTLI